MQCFRSVVTIWVITLNTESRTGEKADQTKLPKIFYVNWFRKDENGKFIWPGYGENIRVLEWIFNRLDGADIAVETPKGFLPKPGTINTEGLDISPERMNKLFEVDKEEGLVEMASPANIIILLRDMSHRNCMMSLIKWNRCIKSRNHFSLNILSCQ